MTMHTAMRAISAAPTRWSMHPNFPEMAFWMHCRREIYASQKPVIHEMAMDWEKGIVHLEFSEDVMTVVFYSNHIWVPERVTQVKGGRMDYHIAPGEFFLRAELITRDGRKAWTSPLRID